MDNLQNEKNYGTLIIWAQSASEAIPIEGATVVVRLARENGESDLFRVLATDESGLIWNDPDLGIEWPVSHPVVSAKDCFLPSLASIKEQILKGWKNV